MGKRDRNREIARLSGNRKVIEDRVELLQEIIQDMEKTNGVPAIPLGGLLDDILKLNPFRAERLIPALLEEYEKELEEVKQLMVSLN